MTDHPSIFSQTTTIVAVVWCLAMIHSASAASAEAPWPTPVANFIAPEPGEHPRLLFRKSDLPRLRERAKTPDGKAILDRLRACLNGGDGESMPTSFNPTVGKVNTDGAGDYHASAALGSYTFSHLAGFGLLYQLTGDRKYADLGRQCFEKALEGVRDRDRRYSFLAPHGMLRAGPVLGWTALGYDLCYDGWDEDYRKKVRTAIAEYATEGGGRKISLDKLVAGDMPPFSNHFGMQTGGAAMALLAVHRDPGVDEKRTTALLAVSTRSMIRNLTEGFGDGGFYAEGDGTGSMASHIVYLTALQAWRVAGGQDFVTPRPNAQWTALKWIFLTVPRAGKPDFWPMRGAYPHNIWARADKSGAGYFGIAFGVLSEPQNAGLLWYYNHHLKEQDAKAGTPFDTVSPYPHLSICAFVNWPMSLAERNPAEVIPRCYRDTKYGFHAFRNRWQDENDIVISVQTRNAHGYHKAPTTAMLEVAAFGKKSSWVKLAGEVKAWQAGADGSGTMLMEDGTALAVDFSKASGAEGMLVTTGAAEGDKVELGGKTLVFRFLSAGSAPKPRVEGDAVVVGTQRVRVVDGALVLGTMAAAPSGAP